jgi:hypothetical protein
LAGPRCRRLRQEPGSTDGSPQPRTSVPRHRTRKPLHRIFLAEVFTIAPTFCLIIIGESFLPPSLLKRSVSPIIPTLPDKIIGILPKTTPALQKTRPFPLRPACHSPFPLTLYFHPLVWAQSLKALRLKALGLKPQQPSRKSACEGRLCAPAAATSVPLITELKDPSLMKTLIGRLRTNSAASR